MVDRGIYRRGDMLPPEKELALRFEVAAANLFRLIRTRSQEAYKIIISTELILRRSTMPLAVVHRQKEPVC